MAGSNKKHFGPTIQKRAYLLLKAIWKQVDESGWNDDGPWLESSWEKEGDFHRLVVRTTLKDLVACVEALEGKETVDTEKVREVLLRLKDLELLQDHRTKVRDREWHFSLKLRSEPHLRHNLEFWKQVWATRSGVGKRDEVESDGVEEKDLALLQDHRTKVRDREWHFSLKLRSELYLRHNREFWDQIWATRSGVGKRDEVESDGVEEFEVESGAQEGGEAETVASPTHKRKYSIQQNVTNNKGTVIAVAEKEITIVMNQAKD